MEQEYLKDELSGLLRYIQRVRTEIAAISRPADEDFKFESMGEQLGAIVKATETATNTIIAAMERNDDIIENIRAKKKSKKLQELCDQLIENDNEVFEACSFQDITGQRINKVVKSITYVEDRVTALVDVWGKEELDKIVIKAEEKTEDEKLLEGPQMEGKGLSQSEVDALFD